MLPSVARVSAPSTTPPANTTPQIVVPVLCALGIAAPAPMDATSRELLQGGGRRGRVWAEPLEHSCRVGVRSDAPKRVLKVEAAHLAAIHCARPGVGEGG